MIRVGERKLYVIAQEKHLMLGHVCPDSNSCFRTIKEKYPYSGHALIFKGSMLVYDPQRDIAQWVPVRGMSATLTMPELRAANDLNNMVPSPLSELPVAKPPATEFVKCIPAGTESNTNSSIVDSGDEWDKTETVGPSRSSTSTTKIGPTWRKSRGHSGRRNGEKPGPSWGDILNTTPTEEGKTGRGGQPVCRGRPVRRCHRRRRGCNTNRDRGGRVRSCGGGGAAHVTGQSG